MSHVTVYVRSDQHAYGNRRNAQVEAKFLPSYWNSGVWLPGHVTMSIESVGIVP